MYKILCIVYVYIKKKEKISFIYEIPDEVLERT